MAESFLTSIKTRFQTTWQFRSLGTRILIPIAGMMLASTLLTILAFVLSTALTRNQLIQQQMTADQERAVQVLTSRVGTVRDAAQILANDPDLQLALKAKTDTSLQLIDNRAVLVRDRFDLDLVQVFDSSGGAWANLVLAQLYQVSSLRDQVGDGQTSVVAVAGRLLLLSQEPVKGQAGTIITGIDLESELQRLASGERLLGDLELHFSENVASSQPEPAAGEMIQHETKLLLGETSVTLLTKRPTTDFNRVTNTGLIVMVFSSLGTTALLLIATGRIVPTITAPIRHLAHISHAVADSHHFDQPVQLEIERNWLRIGDGDELGQLTDAFAIMLAELRELTGNLQQKVETRTRQLQTAAEVARAANAHLDLEQVLHTSVQMIAENFGFTFTGVFLVDEEQEMAVLQAANSDIPHQAGKAPSPLSVSLEQESLIAKAINTCQAAIAQNIYPTPPDSSHPSLPPTRSEAAFPLTHAGLVTGALDVHSTISGAFTPDMLQALTILSDQIAIAIQNARMYGQQREIAHRLSEIDHLKAQFLGLISHELRTPLNSIIGFSTVMLNGLNGPLTDAQHEDLELIQKNGQQLNRMINNLLDLSLMEAGEVELNIQLVDLRLEIGNVLNFARTWVNDKRLDIETDIPLDLPLAPVDNVRFHQLMQNLVSNAIKFTMAGRVKIVVTYNTQWVMVNIHDTGVGIAQEDMDKLFKPFSQVDTTTARKYEGSGVGLSIARYIVELHGGRIWAESEPGVGSTFSFVLPRANEKME